MKVLLVDVSSLFHRAYHALSFRMPDLVDSGGVPCVGTYGFFNTIFKIRAEFVKFDQVVWAIDCAGGSSTRKQIDPEYKAGRKQQSSTFYQDLSNLKKYLSLTKVMPLGLNGYEADDIIASSVRYMAENYSDKENLEVFIASGDGDFELCLDWPLDIKLLKISPLKILTKADVLEKWNVDNLSDIPLLKALIGDSSDNVPSIASKGKAYRLYKDPTFLKVNEQRILRNASLLNFKNDLDVVPRSPDFSPENLEKIFTLMDSKSLLNRLKKGSLV